MSHTPPGGPGRSRFALVRIVVYASLAAFVSVPRVAANDEESPLMKRLRAGPATTGSPVYVLPGVVGPALGMPDDTGTAGDPHDTSATLPGIPQAAAPRRVDVPPAAQTWDGAAESAAFVATFPAQLTMDGRESWRFVNATVALGLGIAVLVGSIAAAVGIVSRQPRRVAPTPLVGHVPPRLRGS
jgi:hypothetical protein